LAFDQTTVSPSGFQQQSRAQLSNPAAIIFLQVNDL